MSSYGAAISIDPYRTKKLPKAVVDFFLKEGWTYHGSRKENPDYSLFEASKP
jgi:hypothetical protein